MSHVGSNPGLHLTSNSCFLDPEFWCICQTVREVRELGNLQHMGQMLMMIGGNVPVPRNGPAMILATRLSRLGWDIHPNGLVGDSYGSFCCMNVHWDELIFRMISSWPKVLATLVSHRTSFAGIENADLHELSKAMKLFSEADQLFVRSGLDGTLYTDKYKEKQNRGRHSVCVYCQAPDSFRHRLWHCPRFEAARAGFRWRQYLSSLPSCLVCHGWPVKLKSQAVLAKHFLQIPAPVFQTPLQSLECECLHLFTDGTCAFPTEPALRYASWAVTAAIPGCATLDHFIVGCGHLSGLIQTSYRSELTALIVALKVSLAIAVDVCIWTDCQAVLSKYRRILNGWVPGANTAHGDLWTQVVELHKLPPGKVRCGKVISHGDIQQATSAQEEWCFWHNQLVDAAASAFNQRRSEQFWIDWQRAASDLIFHRQLHEDILHVILRVGQMEANFSAQQQRATVDSAVGNGQSGCPEPVPHGMGDGHLPVQWSISATLERKGRASNLEPMHWWWLQVVVPQFASGKYEWISGVQMYIDYCFATDCQGPIMVKGKWQEMNEHVLQQYGDTSFPRRIKMFLTLWKAYIKANRLVVPAVLKRPKSSGIAFWCQCYKLPWRSDRLLEIDRVLLSLHRRQLNTLADVDHSCLFSIPKGNVLPIT